MARAALRVGDLVRLSDFGLRVQVCPSLGADHVLKVETRVPGRVYGRPAYTVSCGPDTFVVWAAYVKLLRPRQRKPREHVEETKIVYPWTEETPE